ncbi:hypothetical protein, partial [Roseisolibacter sp. H3M3-2]|uniref:hypothetical protein n=1 Tax=Roseisolibacter sp. H3M3-2 TaxID=3031323 RepID=UPI0023DA5909
MTARLDPPSAPPVPGAWDADPADASSGGGSRAEARVLRLAARAVGAPAVLATLPDDGIELAAEREGARDPALDELGS